MHTSMPRYDLRTLWDRTARVSASVGPDDRRGTLTNTDGTGPAARFMTECRNRG